MEEGLCNVRVQHLKLRPFHFFSQLDITRLWDRVLRRARIPVEYTRGFNPRPKLSFGPALPLGVTSLAEFLDIKLSLPYDPAIMKETLNKELPGELAVIKAENIGTEKQSVSKSIAAMYYTYTFPLKLDKIPFHSIDFPDGVEMIKAPLAERTCFVVSFVFTGKALLANPFKFAQFLRECLSLDAPMEIEKTGVLFAEHSGGFLR